MKNDTPAPSEAFNQRDRSGDSRPNPLAMPAPSHQQVSKTGRGLVSDSTNPFDFHRYRTAVCRKLLVLCVAGWNTNVPELKLGDYAIGRSVLVFIAEHNWAEAGNYDGLKQVVVLALRRRRQPQRGNVTANQYLSICGGCDPMTLVDNQEPLALPCKLGGGPTGTVEHRHSDHRPPNTMNPAAYEVNISIVNPQFILECSPPLIHQRDRRYNDQHLGFGISLPYRDHALHREECLPRASYNTNHATESQRPRGESVTLPSSRLMSDTYGIYTGAASQADGRDLKRFLPDDGGFYRPRAVSYRAMKSSTGVRAMVSPMRSSGRSSMLLNRTHALPMSSLLPLAL